MCSMSTAMASDRHNIYVSKNPSNRGFAEHSETNPSLNPSHPIPVHFVGTDEADFV